MSKNEDFVKEYLESKDCYDGMLRIITKEDFDKETKNIKSSLACYERFFEDLDITLHPLQNIYVIDDSTSSTDNGSFEFNYIVAFKYKGKYYYFGAYGGN